MAKLKAELVNILYTLPEKPMRWADKDEVAFTVASLTTTSAIALSSSSSSSSSTSTAPITETTVAIATDIEHSSIPVPIPVSVPVAQSATASAPPSDIGSKELMMTVSLSGEISAPSSSTFCGTLSTAAEEANAGVGAFTGTNAGAGDSMVPMEVDDDSGTPDLNQVFTDNPAILLPLQHTIRKVINIILTSSLLPMIRF